MAAHYTELKSSVAQLVTLCSNPDNMMQKIAVENALVEVLQSSASLKESFADAVPLAEKLQEKRQLESEIASKQDTLREVEASLASWQEKLEKLS